MSGDVEKEVLRLRARIQENESDDAELRQLILSLNDRRTERINVFTDREMEILREFARKFDISEIDKLKKRESDREALGRVWSMFKAFLLAAAATIVAYNVLIENAAKTIKNVLNYFLGTGGSG